MMMMVRHGYLLCHLTEKPPMYSPTKAVMAAVEAFCAKVRKSRQVQQRSMRARVEARRGEDTQTLDCTNLSIAMTCQLTVND